MSRSVLELPRAVHVDWAAISVSGWGGCMNQNGCWRAAPEARPVPEPSLNFERDFIKDRRALMKVIWIDAVDERKQTMVARVVVVVL